MIELARTRMTRNLSRKPLEQGSDFAERVREGDGSEFTRGYGCGKPVEVREWCWTVGSSSGVKARGRLFPPDRQRRVGGVGGNSADRHYGCARLVAASDIQDQNDYNQHD